MLAMFARRLGGFLVAARFDPCCAAFDRAAARLFGAPLGGIPEQPDAGGGSH